MSNILRSKWAKPFLLLSVFIILSLVIASCSESINEPVQDAQQQSVVLSKDNPRIKAAIEVQEKHTKKLMEIEDVVGTAVGLTEDGQPCVLVLTKTDIKQNALYKGMKNPLPDKIDNLPVRMMVTGEIKAFKTSAVSHKTKQSTPIQLGTSGGWSYDLANGYCCGGTLGSLISTNNGLYILSNYHVFESDIVNGGNGRVAKTGDPVVQPGLIDINCNAANGQNVATLVVKGSLPGSNVDAAIATVLPGMVRTDGAILEIGILSKNIIAAAVGQKVKKSGRTTGLTRSTVSGLNATISVTYDNECAGGSAFTKTFNKQILISNSGSRFLAGGDSGSLMVTDVTSKPQAVGLLFAGGSSIAVANPISEVLSFFGASMVGQ